jgi:GntR family transcriptional regulator, transcriptional repressor for pyruvate dehydrogenase complex
MKTIHEPQADTNLTQRLVIRIREDLLGLNIQPGEAFMTEAELSERYGVSRSITREAVSRLRALGILDSRQGKGLIFRQPKLADVLEMSIPYMAGSAEETEQLARTRYVLETGSIELAVQNASQEQIDRMFALVDQWEACVKDSSRVKEGFSVDAAFHCLLLEMSNVPAMASMHRVIINFFAVTFWPEPTWGENMNRNFWQHRAIAAAVAGRDVEQARSQLRLHVGYLRDWKWDKKRSTGSGAGGGKNGAQ